MGNGVYSMVVKTESEDCDSSISAFSDLSDISSLESLGDEKLDVYELDKLDIPDWASLQRYTSLLNPLYNDQEVSPTELIDRYHNLLDQQGGVFIAKVKKDDELFVYMDRTTDIPKRLLYLQSCYDFAVPTCFISDSDPFEGYPYVDEIRESFDAKYLKADHMCYVDEGTEVGAFALEAIRQPLGWKEPSVNPTHEFVPDYDARRILSHFHEQAHVLKLTYWCLWKTKENRYRVNIERSPFLSAMMQEDRLCAFYLMDHRNNIPEPEEFQDRVYVNGHVVLPFHIILCKFFSLGLFGPYSIDEYFE